MTRPRRDGDNPSLPTLLLDASPLRPGSRALTADYLIKTLGDHAVSIVHYDNNYTSFNYLILKRLTNIFFNFNRSYILVGLDIYYIFVKYPTKSYIDVVTPLEVKALSVY